MIWYGVHQIASLQLSSMYGQYLYVCTYVCVVYNTQILFLFFTPPSPSLWHLYPPDICQASLNSGTSEIGNSWLDTPFNHDIIMLPFWLARLNI